MQTKLNIFELPEPCREGNKDLMVFPDVSLRFAKNAGESRQSPVFEKKFLGMPSFTPPSPEESFEQELLGTNANDCSCESCSCESHETPGASEPPHKPLPAYRKFVPNGASKHGLLLDPEKRLLRILLQSAHGLIGGLQEDAEAHHERGEIVHLISHLLERELDHDDRLRSFFPAGSPILEDARYILREHGVANWENILPPHASNVPGAPDAIDRAENEIKSRVFLAEGAPAAGSGGGRRTVGRTRIPKWRRKKYDMAGKDAVYRELVGVGFRQYMSSGSLRGLRKDPDLCVDSERIRGHIMCSSPGLCVLSERTLAVLIRGHSSDEDRRDDSFQHRSPRPNDKLNH